MSYSSGGVFSNKVSSSPTTGRGGGGLASELYQRMGGKLRKRNWSKTTHIYYFRVMLRGHVGDGKFDPASSQTERSFSIQKANNLLTLSIKVIEWTVLTIGSASNTHCS